MTTFAKSTFSAASYAAFRPTYPPSLYNTVLRYHRGPRNSLLDLGTGPGLVSRYLAPSFTNVLGTDPSPGMITKARDLTPTNEYPRVKFEVSSAEDLKLVEDGSVDMVVAAQAAHWFDYKKVWPELRRVLRKDGTVAFWGYKDHVYIGYPAASRILMEYCYGPDPQRQLGPYWEPGRFITVDKLRPIKPPEDVFEDIQRVEYEPDPKGKNAGEGTLFVERSMTVKQSMGYLRTFSSFHEWEKKFPEKKARNQGGDGDIVDWMYDDMKQAEGWEDEDMLLDIEWGSGLILARKS